jgi:hypothetical protein
MGIPLLEIITAGRNSDASPTGAERPCNLSSNEYQNWVSKGNHKPQISRNCVFSKAGAQLFGMAHIFRSFLTFLRPILVASLVTGCHWMAGVGFDAQSALGSVSLGDRCVDFMRRALPDTRVEITSRQVSAESNNVTVVVGGERSGVPATGPYARNIGVECRFENGVLTGFRWTSGPVRLSGDGRDR